MGNWRWLSVPLLMKVKSETPADCLHGERKRLRKQKRTSE